MNVGKTLFAQVMEFVPWKTFGRIIDRHRGDAGVRTLGCADLFRIMAFAQLTWRESLRDIEACLSANRSKLFHIGLKNVPARSTLSDALNQRDWCIYHALAMRLITRARALYASEPLDFDLDATDVQPAQPVAAKNPENAAGQVGRRAAEAARQQRDDRDRQQQAAAQRGRDRGRLFMVDVVEPESS